MRAATARTAIVCFVSGLSASLAPVLAQRPDRVDRVGEYADYSWSMRTLGGAPITLEAYRGRVVVVNSWATWCEPCVAELASLSALRRALPDSGLAFVLVAAQRAAPVRDFVRRRGIDLPVFLEWAPAPVVYAFEAVPTTWIIDRTGRIAFRHRGAMDWNTSAVRALLRSLLSAPSAPS